MKNNLIITIIIVVVVGAGAFYGGMQYQKTQRGAGSSLYGQAGGAGRRLGTGANGTPVTGKIVAQDATSITSQIQDGSQKIVDLASTTTFSKTSTGSATDLKTGDNISAFGTTNSDGSVTAQNVQINPLFRAGGSGTGTPPRPSM